MGFRTPAVASRLALTMVPVPVVDGAGAGFSGDVRPAAAAAAAAAAPALVLGSVAVAGPVILLISTPGIDGTDLGVADDIDDVESVVAATVERVDALVDLEMAPRTDPVILFQTC